MDADFRNFWHEGLFNILNAVKNGANTFESVSEIAGAGVGCGKCKMLIQNMIDTKK